MIQTPYGVVNSVAIVHERRHQGVGTAVVSGVVEMIDRRALHELLGAIPVCSVRY